MAPVEHLQPSGVGAPYAHYSTVTRVENRLYTAGLVSIDEDGQLVAEGSPREQAAHTCRTLAKICEQYGADLSRVVHCTQYITDRAHYREADAGYAEVFGEHRPSRATVIAGLVAGEFLYELVAVVEL